MAIVEVVVLIAIILGITTVVIYFSRSRDRVMGYHDIQTPRINETTHGEGGGDA